MASKELKAEVVLSGTWLYDDLLTYEVWIVKQNFDWYYDEGFEDGPEPLNANGEVFQIVLAYDGRVINVRLAKQSLLEAVEYAEKSIPQGIEWTNHFHQTLFGGRHYHVTPEK